MKYDPIELMKLNITEVDIQKQRDFILEALTKPYSEEVKIVSFYMDKVWLPFIIDMLDGHEFSVEPAGHTLSIVIKL